MNDEYVQCVSGDGLADMISQVNALMIEDHRYDVVQALIQGSIYRAFLQHESE